MDLRTWRQSGKGPAEGGMKHLQKTLAGELSKIRKHGGNACCKNKVEKELTEAGGLRLQHVNTYACKSCNM